MKPYTLPMLRVLLQKTNDSNQAVAANVLMCLGEVAAVGREDMASHLSELMQAIISKLSNLAHVKVVMNHNYFSVPVTPALVTSHTSNWGISTKSSYNHLMAFCDNPRILTVRHFLSWFAQSESESAMCLVDGKSNNIYTCLGVMPSNEISDEDVLVDGAPPGSHTDHTIPAQILGKRPHEGEDPNSDEEQLLQECVLDTINQDRASNQDEGALITTSEQSSSKGKEWDSEKVHPKKRPRGADEPSTAPSGGSVSRIFRNVYATRLFGIGLPASSSSSSRPDNLHDAQSTQKARQSVTFSPKVKIMPAAGGHTGATEPLAPEASSTEKNSETDNETRNAIVLDAPPSIADTNSPSDQNSLVNSRRGSSNIHNASCTFPDHVQSQQGLLSATQGDSEVDGSDRTDNIGASNEMDTDLGSNGRIARAQPRRECTFVPASKDDFDPVPPTLLLKHAVDPAVPNVSPGDRPGGLGPDPVPPQPLAHAPVAPAIPAPAPPAPASPVGIGARLPTSGHLQFC
ncbi:uncharacterized protein F5147DRAFT_657140 [Suillus discolor]|uniref:Uncharacterized protein n=1 Tax=Suillus discolor TaxID=1912936 RepID=A0A9P7EWI8_9AGAM|nr:uncharacterized protein F5147DRAFT_657140 [Suillus discolor]KAG2094668.1 hypothetical protein F5147DRAFT_657140 [Suillus discolor]